jgi:hypothetical protein
VRLINAPPPRDALTAAPGTALELLMHNAPVALWPLTLVALGWPALLGMRRVGDVLVAGQLAGHGAIVGSALAQQPELWRYLPHLPPEWLALALPAATWMQTRAGTPRNPRRLIATAAAASALLALAAGLETYLVPLP